ncbi:hypothetical protein EJ06DRAFT_479082 [Trichodelitschia bisporula]|uniref:Uncharacterized protein n=1 Tax=Trichodelitschia bisporula TaxID=703511 RepID=A0A6G1HT01_9PEZI|nr:hypothetical protein EJ06DRAFT_479082 [Trichodelitschia bisporula]
MPSLIVVVFALQAIIHIVNSVGAAAINEMLWALYSKFPTLTSKAAQEQIRLRREVVRLKRELGGVSAQDDFARWAKLRRQNDKAMADYEKHASSLTQTKATFDYRVGILRMFITTIPRWALQFWFARTAIYWVPKGWIPGYAEWLLSFPTAPRGSVSIHVWALACASVVSLIGEAVTAAIAIGLGSKAQGAEVEPEPAKAKKDL